MSNGNKCHGVPVEYTTAWRLLYDAARPEEGRHLSSVCPACREKTLYRYYSLMKAQLQEIHGVMYQGPGSYWEWCSACQAFEHMSGCVPIWWDVEPLNIDHSKLTAIPDLIDEAIRGES